MRSSMTTHSAMAQAPVAAMSSTSAYGIQSTSFGESKATANEIKVRGIYTSASAIQGGVTSSDIYNRSGAPKRKSQALPPGACPHCDWQYNEETEEWYCPYCDCDPEDGECEHNCVPIGDGWQVMLFVVALSVAYAIYKKRTCTLQ